ncbi:MAG TPA: D-alanyl-D-alanine carboxypeptidase, partial [Novosphingobium sp.]|nr:D-alanyl-D-alanine carboxypeptidase [Novosphingobium sp.]
TLAVPKGFDAKVGARVVYRGPLRAPIAKGAQVAGLEVTIEGQPVHYLPLVAAETVDRAGPIDRIVNGLLGLVS